MKWKSPWDGSFYEIKPAHGTIGDWKRGKCWSVACMNGCYIVNISAKGLWKLGYCWDTYELMRCRNSQGGGYHPRGKWFLAEKGKLKELKS